MATFTPPSTLDGLATSAENRASRTDVDASRLANRLMRHFVAVDRSPNIYKLDDDTYTYVEPYNLEGVVITYLGGHITEITAQEEADLTAAGYGAGITP